MLSDKAKQLIPKARIISFADWQNSESVELINLFQQADDERRYLSSEDLAQIQIQAQKPTELITVTNYLRDNAESIVAAARAKVLAQFPQITEPGGELYPPERAQACWRDFWHFLRCVTYGIAGGHEEFTSQEGLHNMRLLYQEMRVPLDAMILGLECLKAESLARLAVESVKLDFIAQCFDHLIMALRGFKQ